jgi:hypothetical protein
VQAFVGVAGGDPKEECKECHRLTDSTNSLWICERRCLVSTFLGATALLIGTATSTPPVESTLALSVQAVGMCPSNAASLRPCVQNGRTLTMTRLSR